MDFVISNISTAMTNRQYLLDTNVLIEFLEGTPSVIQHILEVGASKCCMSVISLHELYYGAQLAKERKKEYYEKEIKKINKLLENFTVIDLSAKGEQYGRIKHFLKSKGIMIDEFDILIAEHAMEEGLTVVTDNIDHFCRIEGLKIENWMEH